MRLRRAEAVRAEAVRAVAAATSDATAERGRKRVGVGKRIDPLAGENRWKMLGGIRPWVALGGPGRIPGRIPIDVTGISPH